jgi:hypothetical protein
MHAAQAIAFLVPFERAARTLQAQGIPRAPAGNPLAEDAPWKRMDLHRLGQDDCERLGGIFYFRILFFNVRSDRSSLPSLSCHLCRVMLT